MEETQTAVEVPAAPSVAANEKMLKQLDRILGYETNGANGPKFVVGFIAEGPELWRTKCRQSVAAFKAITADDPRDITAWQEVGNELRMAYRDAKMSAEEDGQDAAQLAAWIVSVLGAICEYTIQRAGRFPEREYLDGKAGELRSVLTTRADNFAKK
jgi:hypothetical protein